VVEAIKRFLVVLFVALAGTAGAQDKLFIELNALNTQIRDQAISKEAALRKIKELLPQAEAYYRSHSRSSSAGWVFPLRGYNSAAIGGKNGSGYIAGCYSFFDGNKHGGHPAHDIFIQDANQDCIDDKTGKDVEVLSCTGGIVVATETTWQPGSIQRGGNYIMIYAPAERRFLYYAHNKTLLVKPGDIVTAGQAIATVGRSGANAAKKRSPTHLHFMVLKLDAEDYPRPENSYDMLKKARGL
jgi:murein DD-endopeptidase MepM/ murein hydrolase activator NlpD